MTVATFGYLLSMLGFGSLFALLWMSQLRDETCDRRLRLAVAASFLWSACMAWHGDRGGVQPLLLYFTELLADMAWTAVLVAHLGRRLAPLLRRLIAALWVTIVAGSVLLLPATSVPLGAIGREGILFIAGIAASLPALALLGVAMRRLDVVGRAAHLPLAIGVGGLFGYDLITHISSLLDGAVMSAAWQSRGFANALLVPVIAVAAKRDTTLAPGIYVSRYVVAYLGSGVFIATYAIATYRGSQALLTHGGAVGTLGGMLAPAAAAIALMVVLTRDAFLRGLVVFVRKHFFRTKYDHRQEWLRFIATMSDASAGDIRQRALRSVTQVFGSPGALLFECLRTPGFAATAAWPEPLIDEAPRPLRREDPLVEFLRRRRWIVDLAEFHAHRARYDGLQLPPWLAASARARLIVPLFNGDDLVGIVLLQDPPGPFVMTYEDRDLLQTLGRHVATSLVQHHADEQLAELRQFESYNHMTAFLMHDLKNAVAQLELLTYNAERHRQSPEFFDDAITTVRNAVQRIRGLIDTLGGRKPADRPRPVGLAAVLQDAADLCAGRQPTPALLLATDEFDVLADAERLSAVFGHLLRNAQDATPDAGSICVTLRRFGREAVVSIIDTGRGMSPEFVRERLFRPFNSTKGARGMGLGTFQAREYLSSLGGSIEVISTPGGGTTFIIRLPLLESVDESESETGAERGRRRADEDPSRIAGAARSAARGGGRRRSVRADG